ncbi:MAG: hypothetical protein K6F37_07880 [Lachnospiraceae bacterium]|nr:hypothetical protein [Lachnospiraceae bacterium]
MKNARINGTKLHKWIWVYLIVAFVVVSVGLLIFIAMESNRLRHFKTDLFVLCTESSICVADGPDGTVRVNNSNWGSIYSILEKTHGSITFDSPESSDTITFDFTCHDEKWILSVDKISDEKVRVHLTGENEYVVYIKNDGIFEQFVKASSIESFNENNKKMG